MWKSVEAVCRAYGFNLGYTKTVLGGIAVTPDEMFEKSLKRFRDVESEINASNSNYKAVSDAQMRSWFDAGYQKAAIR